MSAKTCSLTLGLAGVLLAGCSTGGQTKKPAPRWAAEVREVRERLGTLLAKEDEEFLLEYGELLREHGVELNLVFGDRLVAGGGFMLLTTRSRESKDWILVDDSEREVRVPKGHFVRFLVRGEVLEAAPAEDASEGIVFIGLGEEAALIRMNTGTMRRVS
jgi:hypothetical protein